MTLSIPRPTGYYTVQESARLLGIHPDSVHKAIRRGALEAYRYGVGRTGAYLIPVEALNAYIARHATYAKPGRKTSRDYSWRRELLPLPWPDSFGDESID